MSINAGHATGDTIGLEQSVLWLGRISQPGNPINRVKKALELTLLPGLHLDTVRLSVPPI